MYFNDSVLQVCILFVWAIGFVLSPLGNWRSKVYAALGAMSYGFYTLKLYFEVVQSGVVVLSFNAQNTYFLSGELKAEPIGMIFIVINALALIVISLKKQTEADINYKRYYFQTFLLAATVNMLLMVTKLSSFAVILELAFLQFIILLKLNARDKLETSLKNSFPMFAISFVLSMVALVLLEEKALNVVEEGSLSAIGRISRYVAVIFLTCSFGIKAGIFPFHKWLVTSVTYGTDRSTAVLFGMVGRLGLLGIIKFILIRFSYEMDALSKYFLLFGIISVAFITIKIHMTKSWNMKKAYYYVLGAGVFMVALGLPNLGTVVGSIMFIVTTTVLSLAFVIMKFNEDDEKIDSQGRKIALGYISFFYGIPILGLFTAELVLVYGLASESIAICIGISLLLCAVNTALMAYLYNGYYIRKGKMFDDSSELCGLLFVSLTLVLIGINPNIVLKNLIEVINLIASS